MDIGSYERNQTTPTPALISALNNAADRVLKTLSIAQELRSRLGVVMAPEQPMTKSGGGVAGPSAARESSIRDRVESQSRTVDEIASVLSDILGRLEV